MFRFGAKQHNENGEFTTQETMCWLKITWSNRRHVSYHRHFTFSFRNIICSADTVVIFVWHTIVFLLVYRVVCICLMIYFFAQSFQWPWITCSSHSQTTYIHTFAQSKHTRAQAHTSSSTWSDNKLFKVFFYIFYLAEKSTVSNMRDCKFYWLSNSPSAYTVNATISYDERCHKNIRRLLFWSIARWLIDKNSIEWFCFSVVVYQQ